MYQNQGIGSPNSRLATIKRFLAKPPARAEQLILIAAGSVPVPLGEWTRVECTPVLAEEINETISEHAADSGQRENAYTLSYLDPEGAVLTSRTIRHRAMAGSTEQAMDMAQSLDGSMASQIVQMQRFLEGHTRLYLTAQQAMVQQAMDLATKMGDRLIESMAREDMVREELTELRHAIADEPENQNSGAPQTDTPAQTKLLSLLERALPLLMLQAQARQTRPAAPPAPRPAPEEAEHVA